MATKAQIQAELEEAQARIQELEAATTNLRQEQLVMLSVRIPKSLRQQAKFAGQRKGLTLQEVVGDALRQWVTIQAEREGQEPALFDTPPETPPHEGKRPHFTPEEMAEERQRARDLGYIETDY